MPKRCILLALAIYDKTTNGGNNDEKISIKDNVFTSLRLWQDTNHNGVSELSELKTLQQLGLAEIDLKYKESKLTDEYGNQFRYRAKVGDLRGSHINRWAWDVFLKRETSSPQTALPNNQKFNGLIANWIALSTLDQPFSFIVSNLQYTNPVGGCSANTSIKTIN
ncbi:MAG TPA: hypothetical protein VF648_14855 [Pyrinomonadaceae bacterium]|jgi:hypothetical protein